MIVIPYWLVAVGASLAAGGLHYAICRNLPLAIGVTVFLLLCTGAPIIDKYVDVTMP
jgi:hypothetical protein